MRVSVRTQRAERRGYVGDGLTVGVLEPDLDETVEGLAGDEGPVGDGVVGLAGVVPGRGLGAGRRGLEGLRGGGERGARKGESGAEEEEDAGELHRGRRKRRRGARATGAGGSEKDSRSQKRGRRSFYGAALGPAPGGSRRGLASCIEIGKCAAGEGVDVFCKVPGRQRGAAEKSVERCFLRGGMGRHRRGRMGGD